MTDIIDRLKEASWSGKSARVSSAALEGAIMEIERLRAGFDIARGAILCLAAGVPNYAEYAKEVAEAIICYRDPELAAAIDQQTATTEKP